MSDLLTGIEVAGVRGIELDGDLVRMTLFPDVGAKILDLVHKPTGVDLLWKNPRVPLRRTYPGPNFDDVWCGGWDELFPTDPACTVGDTAFHDHGDLWFGPWDWDVVRDDGSEIELHLSRYTVALPCLMEKWITFRRDSPRIDFHHRLSNLGTQPIPYTWSIHIAHAIAPGSRIHLPAKTMTAVPEQPGRFGDAPDVLAWPEHGGVDMSTVETAESGLTEWLYTRDLDAGWCAVSHAHGAGLVYEFDPEVFEMVWLWGVYGGWRGHYVLLTEPSTSPPGGLAESVASGTARTLGAGGVLEMDAAVTVVGTRPEGGSAARMPGE